MDNRILTIGQSLDPIAAEEGIRRVDEQLSTIADKRVRAGLLLNKAVFLGVLKDIREARRQLQFAIEQAADDPETQLSYDFLEAALYHEEEKFEDAYSCFTTTLTKHCDLLERSDYRFVYEKVQEYRAFELVRLGKFEDAVTILEEALSFDREEKDKQVLLANLGISHAKLNHHERARAYLQQAIHVGNLGDWEGQTHYHLALAYAHLNLLPESKRELRLCAERAREYSLPLSNVYGWLSRICRGLGERQEAEHYAQLARPV